LASDLQREERCFVGEIAKVEGVGECQGGSDSLEKINAKWSRFLGRTLEENSVRNLSTPEYEGSERRRDDMQEEGITQGDRREDALKLLLGRVCCVVGLLMSAGGIVFAILGASVNLSARAVGIALGVLGYFLGARRLGVASVVVGTAALFFMAAASTGLIPGVAPLGHGYD
jgi:hypothetical protein